MPEPMPARIWGLLLLLSLVWGTSFFLMAVALTGLPPLLIACGRLVLAAAALVGSCLVLGLPLPRGRAAWLACAGMGLLNNAIPFTLIVFGQQHIPSGLASVVNAATPVFGVLAAAALAGERLTPGRLGGTLTGLAGVAVLAGPAALAPGRGSELTGIALCLGACLSYGLGAVWSRRVAATGMRPLSAAAGQCVASALMLLPLALAVDRPWTLPAPPAEALLALLALGLVATAFAYYLFFTILAGAGGTNTLLVTLLVPVTAVFLGVAVLGEALAPRHFAGMALIGAGLLLIDGRMTRLVRAR
jgi:drug/metabolite transporter (DMT)-like permease